MNATDSERDVEKDQRAREVGHSPSADSFEVNSIDKPIGIRRVEALSEQYGPKGKVMVFFFVFLISYCYGLDGQVRSTYQATATASYSSHSLLATINVVKAIIGAAIQPILARLSDVFGRNELLILSIVFYTAGTIVDSQATNVSVYAGGAVIFQIGYTGIQLMLQLIVADLSLLNWRLAASFVPAIPFIINTWISGNVTSRFIPNQWSWGIAMWAIVLPVVSIPLILSLFDMARRAKKSGAAVMNVKESEWRRLGARRYLSELFWKLDIVGSFLLAAFLALLLIPFTLAGGVDAQWRKAKTIVPLILGGLLLPCFIVWERFCPHPMTPFRLLKDRGVWSALIIGIFINFIWYMQGDYLYTVLIVAFNQSVSSATRISSLYSFVSVIAGTILGLIVSRIRRLKPFIVSGTALWLVAMGLLIRYRTGPESKAGLIGAECVLGFGAGLFTYPVQALLQSCTKHEHMAVITALYLTMYQVGSALGGTVSGAIWTQVLPKELAKRINDPTLVLSAYGDPFTFIATYPWGTAERAAIVDAYKVVQKDLTVTGACLCVPLIAVAFLLRNNYLESAQSSEKAEEHLD